MEVKKCSKCQIEKNLGEFHKNKSKKDGFASHCKGCFNHDARNRGRSEKKKEYDKAYKRTEKSCKKQKEYRRTEKCRKKRIEYQRKRYKTDPSFRMVMNLRRRILHALNGTSKSANSQTLIGCTFEEFRKHIESLFQQGMSWDLVGPQIEIDHIRPLASFDLTQPEEQKKAFHFSNCQPLWKDANRRKSDTMPDVWEEIRHK